MIDPRIILPVHGPMEKAKTTIATRPMVIAQVIIAPRKNRANLGMIGSSLETFLDLFENRRRGDNKSITLLKVIPFDENFRFVEQRVLVATQELYDRGEIREPHDRKLLKLPC
jgi:hypothetical protein